MSAAQFFSIASNVANIAPGVAGLVAVVEAIHNTVHNMKRNKQQCEQLVQFCRTIVESIDTSLKEQNVQTLEGAPALQQALLKFDAMLKATLVDVQKLASYNALDSVLKQDKIKQVITDRRVALTDCFTIFGGDVAQISSSLQLQKWNYEFQKAADADHGLLLKAVEAMNRQESKIDTFTRQQQEQYQHLAGLGSAQTPPPPTMYRTQSIHSTDMEHALRILQLRLRMEPVDSATHASLETTLRELQRTGGDHPLPLADLCGEAKKIGNTPVYYSATAEIWQGIWLGDRTRLVALKSLRGTVPLSPNAIRRFHRQVEIVRTVQHRNIIQLYGVSYVDGNNLCLVFPWMEHGDVTTYLQKFPHADRIKIMLGVARGLAHLHHQNPPMVHSGLQPSNILIDDQHEAIVSDFGLAKTLVDCEGGANYTLSNGAQVSMRWMAPELSDSTYSTPADVYAWAMTALHVISGLQPFWRIKQPGRVVIHVHQGKRPVLDDYPEGTFSGEFWNLLERCWQSEPEDRPSMDDVVDFILNMRPDLRNNANYSSITLIPATIIMQFPRVFSVLSVLFAFAFFFTSATPIESDKTLAKRQETEILTILTALHTSAVGKATEIKTLALTGTANEDNVTPLFNELIEQFNAATTQLAALQPSGKRQAPVDVATLTATILTDVTTILDSVLTQLAGIEAIGGLFAGLDTALNQLLKGLEGLLAGLLNLVATLLVDVAGLLRNLALGLTLASLGL
ncbi:kinase-like protein [Exidia glandulosa HHB12029]|uniref:Kinase-like protein n=1 Tax=Exidia glandulosa HHB12029 TaxID=1314781 RepID=A0A165EYS2_EXIGL|nr:kinase-like protein [Exidia glandulosa HHB12029]